MPTYTTETPWDTAPDSTSTYEIYKPDDFWIYGNGIDPIQKYDTNMIEDLEGAPPKGKIFENYKHRLWVAGDPSFLHRVWFSHFRNAEGWSKKTDWYDIYPNDGGIINGLGIRNDELIVTKDNSKTYGLRIFEDGDPFNSRLRVIEDDKGAISTRSAITSENIRYLLGKDQIFTVPRTKTGGISYIVQEVIEAITKTNPAMGAHRGKIHASIGNVTFDADGELSLVNAELVYDTVNQGFFMRDNVDAQVYTVFRNSDGEEKLYFGDSNGRVFKADTGTRAGSNPIHMLIRTKKYFADVDENVTVRKVGIWTQEPDGMKATYRIKKEEDFVRNLGEIDDEPIQWFDSDGEEGPFYQMQFTHSGATARPAIFGWAIIYRLASKKDNARRS